MFICCLVAVKSITIEIMINNIIAYYLKNVFLTLWMFQLLITPLKRPSVFAA